MDESKMQAIFFHPEEGLCNRLKKIFSVMRLKADISRPVYIVWSTSKFVNEKFGSVLSFVHPKIKLTEVEDKDLQGKEIENITGDFNYRLRIIEDDGLEQGFTKASPKYGKDECIDFEYERIPQKIREIYMPYFAALRPSEAVEDRMEELKNKENYVSVHVRLNSEWRKYMRGNKRDLRRYFKVMDKYPSDTKFYLASCDEVVAAEFKKRYGGVRILELPDKDYIGLKDAVADLFLLSRGEELIGTYGSTFSEVAWWLSGCQQKVQIIGSWKDWITKGNVPDGLMGYLKATVRWFIKPFRR